VRPEIPGATIHPIGGEVTQTQLSWSGRKKKKARKREEKLENSILPHSDFALQYHLPLTPYSHSTGARSGCSNIA